jgi:hypothetical protein
MKINASDYSPPNVNYWGGRCSRAEARAERLREALNDLLNDCINHDGGKLTDAILAKASAALLG